MKIYTKTGDAGQTSLYGGARVAKSDLRVAAYGTVDEANAAIGLARANLRDEELDRDLALVQETLFALGADLATPLASSARSHITPIADDDIAGLERRIDHYEGALEPLQNFILPGGHAAAAALHLARAVVRRAERDVVKLVAGDGASSSVAVYLNRLSDFLFVLARVVNVRSGVSEVRWHVRGDRRHHMR